MKREILKPGSKSIKVVEALLNVPNEYKFSIQGAKKGETFQGKGYGWCPISYFKKARLGEGNQTKYLSDKLGHIIETDKIEYKDKKKRPQLSPNLYRLKQDIKTFKFLFEQYRQMSNIWEFAISNYYRNFEEKHSDQFWAFKQFGTMLPPGLCYTLLEKDIVKDLKHFSLLDIYKSFWQVEYFSAPNKTYIRNDIGEFIPKELCANILKQMGKMSKNKTRRSR